MRFVRSLALDWRNKTAGARRSRGALEHPLLLRTIYALATPEPCMSLSAYNNIYLLAAPTLDVLASPVATVVTT